MALIKCSECGKEISDKATACPHCGCPLEVNRATLNEKKEEKKVNVEETKETKIEMLPEKKSGKKAIIITIAIIVVIAIAAGGYYFTTANSRNYESAITDYNNENYDSALTKFQSLGDYEDSAEMAEKCEYELSVDGQFMSSLKKSLQARWDLNNDADENAKEEDTAKKDYCECELGYLSDFSDKEFSDATLGEYAKEYIDLLNQAEDSLKYYSSNYTKYINLWEKVYGERTILLQKLVNEYNLTVDEEYQETLDGLMIDAEGAKEKAALLDAVDDMISNVKIKHETDEWGYTSYSTTIKNTTDYTFDYFDLEINVIDQKGTLLDSTSSDSLSNWKPGKKGKVSIYIDSEIDPDDIDQYEITASWSSGDYYSD